MRLGIDGSDQGGEDASLSEGGGYGTRDLSVGRASVDEVELVRKLHVSLAPLLVFMPGFSCSNDFHGYTGCRRQDDPFSVSVGRLSICVSDHHTGRDTTSTARTSQKS